MTVTGPLAECPVVTATGEKADNGGSNMVSLEAASRSDIQLRRYSTELNSVEGSRGDKKLIPYIFPLIPWLSLRVSNHYNTFIKRDEIITPLLCAHDRHFQSKDCGYRYAV